MRNNKLQDADRYSPDAELGGVCTNRGKGPKSYKRSDARIFEDICRRMTENQYLDASDIAVSVQDGDVLLTGSVDGRYEKRLAEVLGETAYGVRNVENRLKIKEKRS